MSEERSDEGLDREKLVIGLAGGLVIGVVIALGSGNPLVGVATGLALGVGTGVGMAVR